MMQKPKEFTGKHMAIIVVLFFGIIIGVNVLMIVSSARTWTGLVVPNSYVASQEFQERADAAHAQDDAGWTMDVHYRQSELVVVLQDDGRMLHVTGVSAFVRRPVGGHDDATVALAEGEAEYVGRIDLAPGVWDITVTSDETELGRIERETRVTVQ